MEIRVASLSDVPVGEPKLVEAEGVAVVLFRVGVAVVDEAGHLIACHCMDGALWVTPEIARAKANAAAGFQTSTLDLEERFNKGRQLFAGNVASLPEYAFVFGRGAVPIVVNGHP